MGYENWQARPRLKLAERRARLRDSDFARSPSLGHRLIMLVALSIGSWGMLSGAGYGLMWVFHMLAIDG